MTTILRRDWATPLTIGAFLLMALTGLAMFFHLETPLQKEVHEWAGWLMVTGVALHVVVNWMAFKRYFQALPRGLGIVSVFALVTLGSFFVRGAANGEAGSPPAVAINALTRAPIAQVAPLFGKTPQQAREQLAAAGIVLQGDEATLVGAVGGQREQIGRALAVLASR
jgi:hypothetical protein